MTSDGTSPRGSVAVSADEAIAMLQQGGGIAPALDPPIGGYAVGDIPPAPTPNYQPPPQVTTDRGLVLPSARNARPRPGDPGYVGPQGDTGPIVYRKGQDFLEWLALPLESRRRLQDRLVALSFTDSIEFPGEYDRKTKSGFRYLLDLSNSAGTTWQDTLSRLTELKEQGVEIGLSSLREEIPAYRPPDYESFANDLHGLMQQRLGREPTQGEARLMFDKWQELHQQDYQADRQAILDEGAGRTVTEPDLDPVGAFENFFRQRTEGEFQVAQRNEQVSQSSRETTGQLESVARIAGS